MQKEDKGKVNSNDDMGKNDLSIANVFVVILFVGILIAGFAMGTMS